MEERLYQKVTFPNERDLAKQEKLTLVNCEFKGDEINESALKEAKLISIYNCNFYLRYPLWHVDTVHIKDSTFFESARGPLWYSKKISIFNSKFESPKLLRECEIVDIYHTNMVSNEIFWKCKNIEIRHSVIEGEYAFFESKNINIKDLKFKGKYSFQYVDNLIIKDSELDTKDAFWHATNVEVTNCVLKGEYLGWYSNNLTLKNCKIISHQPLCYCSNLKLIDCELIDSDFSFENSEVDAVITSDIISVRKIKKGKITANNIKEYYKDNEIIKDLKEIKE